MSQDKQGELDDGIRWKARALALAEAATPFLLVEGAMLPDVPPDTVLVERPGLDGEPPQRVTVADLRAFNAAARDVWRRAGDAKADAPKAPAGTLRGVVSHRFQDGGWQLAIDGGCVLRHPGPRLLHLRADELRGEVGRRATIRIEVDHE